MYLSRLCTGEKLKLDTEGIKQLYKQTVTVERVIRTKSKSLFILEYAQINCTLAIKMQNIKCRYKPRYTDYLTNHNFELDEIEFDRKLNNTVKFTS